MKHFFEKNTNWKISKKNAPKETVKGVNISEFLLKSEFYFSKKKWKVCIQSLILKSTMKSNFNAFFHPMKVLLGIVVFWDCNDCLVLSKPMSIYISNQNTRKMRKVSTTLIPAQVEGALAIQLFVLEDSQQVELFSKNAVGLIKNIQRKVAIRTGGNFDDVANEIHAQLMGTMESKVIGYEILRVHYPSGLLIHQPSYTKEQDTLFYNIVIHIEPWRN